MEVDSYCLFCRSSDSTLYEMNNNEIVVGSEIISFQEMIYEVFLTKIVNNVSHSICEECKNLLVDFYVFKNTAKPNLSMPKPFAYLKQFLDSNDSDPVVRITQNEFIVSFPNIEELQPEEYVMEEIDEEELEPDELVEEDEVVSEFAMDTLNDDSDTALTDQEYEVQIRSPDAEKLEQVSEPEVIRKSYLCDCGAELPSVQELQKHMSQHKRRPGKSKLSCNEKSCETDFRDQKYLEIHEKAHENFEAIAPHLLSHICSHCGKMFLLEDDYMIHLQDHAGDNEYQPLSTLDRRSAYEDYMVRRTEHHNVEEPNNEEFISCGYCSKRALENEIKIHLLFFHTHVVFCPLDNRCFEGFKQVRMFSDHIRNKHPEIFNKTNLYACRHCNKSFDSHFEKLAHMKQCGSKLFACEGHCDKRFATEWLLKLHKRQIQGFDRFRCDVCDKVCVSKSDLQIHNRSHTNERPYECTICFKGFKTSANRASHMDIHEAEKRHACEICGEKFQTRPIMRKHKKKHDSKYMSECVCKICHRQYITKPHMLRHVKDFHGASQELKTSGLAEFFEGRLDCNG